MDCDSWDWCNTYDDNKIHALFFTMGLVPMGVRSIGLMYLNRKWITLFGQVESKNLWLQRLTFGLCLIVFRRKSIWRWLLNGHSSAISSCRMGDWALWCVSFLLVYRWRSYGSSYSLRAFSQHVSLNFEQSFRIWSLFSSGGNELVQGLLTLSLKISTFKNFLIERGVSKLKIRWLKCTALDSTCPELPRSQKHKMRGLLSHTKTNPLKLRFRTGYLRSLNYQPDLLTRLHTQSLQLPQ